MASTDHEHFKTFGFATWRNALSAEEVRQIEDELMSAMEQAHTARPFDGSERHWLPLLTPRTPKIASLAEDPRFYEKAKELVDGDVILMVTDGNRYVTDTPWHPDGVTGKTSLGVKFFVYLGSLRADTGALRVVPGSHLEPLHQELGEYARRDGVGVDDIPSYSFDCEPGDVLAFDFPIWHASAGGSKDRRMCTVEYYRKPSNEEEWAAVKGHFGVVEAVTKDAMKGEGFPFYDPAWVEDPEQSDTRREIIANMREAGFFANPANLGRAEPAPV
ncbi:MAG: phytanoyl-CoA dioxygenase family protein [Candidatus Dormibacteria bacterium]